MPRCLASDARLGVDLEPLKTPITKPATAAMQFWQTAPALQLIDRQTIPRFFAAQQICVIAATAAVFLRKLAPFQRFLRPSLLSVIQGGSTIAVTR